MNADYIYNLGSAFSAIAGGRGGACALRYPDGRQVTYHELEAAANRSARALLDLGVRHSQVVVLFNNKSPIAFAAMLGCLKIGAVYSNLDVSSPAERIGKMLDRCQPALVLHEAASDELLGVVERAAVRAVSLTAPDWLERRDGQAADPLPAGNVTGADAAYIMFTSGSTGFPKGAVMSHANVLNLVAWAKTEIGVQSDDVLTNVNPIYFDNSVFDFYAALFNGAALCPVTADITGDPRALVGAVQAAGCTSWFSVPSLLVYLLTMRALKADAWPQLRRFVFGGEGFPKARLKDLWELFGARVEFVNVYGPTECTCICSAYRITTDDIADQERLAPLGYMAPNFGYRIDPIDDADPATGELLLSGSNVGLGYYRDAERTAKSFVQDPFEANYRRILYRTGDLVRRDAHGQVHFLGRVDNQIKHMGYRIELEEVEAAFQGLSQVREVGVVYHKNAQGLGQILAFVSSDDDPESLLAAVRAVLPPYMVPRKVIRLDALPKNRNGKVDRVQLKQNLEALAL